MGVQGGGLLRRPLPTSRYPCQYQEATSFLTEISEMLPFIL